MAFVFTTHRPNIANRMAAGDKETLRWLDRATFAKASTGHWLAWHQDDPGQAMVLPPDHPADRQGIMLDNWDTDPKIEDFIEYVESGELERNPPGELNLFIEDPVTGECK